MTRRHFLQTASALVAAARTNAQSSSDYRALVCIFLFGGSDGNNLIVPAEQKAYETYARGRQSVALGSKDLLSVQAQGKAFGLHPRLADFAQIVWRKALGRFGQHRPIGAPHYSI
jgi:uncharacterized protein (DUF1501 family)